MVRRDFVKSLFALGALATIPLDTIVEYEPTVIIEGTTILDFNPAPKGWFKVTTEFWQQCTKEAPLYPTLDQLCIKMCGTPFKEVGFMDDDFSKNMITVYAFGKDPDNYNGKMMYDK